MLSLMATSAPTLSDTVVSALAEDLGSGDVTTAATLLDEGQWRERGRVFELDGRAAALLSAERTALTFLQRLSGVATMAARCVAEIEGTGAQILDTRNTR